MAIIIHITSPHSLFLVPTYDRRSFCKRAFHPSRALLFHPIFFCTIFQPTFSFRPIRAAHPARGLHRALNISPTGGPASWASMSFPGCQTGSRRPHSAQIVVTIITGTAMIYHQNGEHFNARTAFQRLNKSFRVRARYANRSCGRRS
jgi:hypothetical protein